MSFSDAEPPVDNKDVDVAEEVADLRLRLAVAEARLEAIQMERALAKEERLEDREHTLRLLQGNRSGHSLGRLTESVLDAIRVMAPIVVPLVTAFLTERNERRAQEQADSTEGSAFDWSDLDIEDFDGLIVMVGDRPRMTLPVRVTKSEVIRRLVGLNQENKPSESVTLVPVGLDGIVEVSLAQVVYSPNEAG